MKQSNVSVYKRVDKKYLNNDNFYLNNFTFEYIKNPKMGPRSPRTEINHKAVVDCFFKKQNEKGDLKNEIRRRTLYQEVADETNYSFDTVRLIICKYFKTKTRLAARCR